MDAAPAPALDALPAALTHLILCFLSADDLAAVASSCSTLRAAVSDDDALWARHCREELFCDAPAPPPSDAVPGAAPSTHRETYAAWAVAFSRYRRAGTLRAGRAFWAVVERWAAQHLPPLLVSLSPGCGEASLDAAESILGRPLPDSLRLLYRMHNGQAALMKGQPGPHSMLGLWGGYSFYGHVAVCAFLPLDNAVAASMRDHAPTGRRRLVFGVDGVSRTKRLLVDADSATVWASSELGSEAFMASPATASPGTGLRLWLDEFTRRLDAGDYRSARLVPDVPLSRGISLFPRHPPRAGRHVTRCVAIEASAAFVPERSRPAPVGATWGSGGAQCLYAYTIRMRYLPPGVALTPQDEGGEWGWAVEAIAAAGGDAAWPPGSRPPASVQLRGRRWAMRDDAGGLLAEVQGDGVIGEHPLLTAGGPVFEYASCSQQAGGSMEGAFSFVEGSLASPGETFDAIVGRFPLEPPPDAGYLF